MRRLAARIGAGVISATVVLTATTASAAPASVPGARWHLVQRSHATPPAHYTWVAAAGPRNAWVLGQSGPAAQNSVLVHWNGKSWQRQALPRNFAAGMIAASSSVDLWAFGFSRLTKAYQAQRWNGRAWTTVPMPRVPDGYAVVLSRSDVWVASDSRRLLHWDGTAWTSSPYEFPGWQPLAAAGGHVWRVDLGKVGGKANRLIVRTWNGTSWKWVSSPHPAVGRHGGLGISASSARNIWISIRNTSFLHWNGARWSRAGAPPSVMDIGAMAAVGRSAMWLGALGLWNGKRWVQAPPSDCVAYEIGQLAAVPGTGATLCAEGGPASGGNGPGEVWLNGRLR